MRSLPADRFPNTVALAGTLTAGTADERFEWGLDVIVRGLATYLKEPPDPAGVDRRSQHGGLAFLGARRLTGPHLEQRRG